MLYQLPTCSIAYVLKHQYYENVSTGSQWFPANFPANLPSIWWLKMSSSCPLVKCFLARQIYHISDIGDTPPTWYLFFLAGNSHLAAGITHLLGALHITPPSCFMQTDHIPTLIFYYISADMAENFDLLVHRQNNAIQQSSFWWVQTCIMACYSIHEHVHGICNGKRKGKVLYLPSVINRS